MMQVHEMTTSLVVTFICHSMRADVFEIRRPAVFFGQEIGAGEELAGCAAGTLGRVRAIVVWNVIVANVTEPANLGG